MYMLAAGFTDLSEKCSANIVSGSDQLTAILNDYMGAMIEEVLKIDGDVLKFAGMAATYCFVLLLTRQKQHRPAYY